MEQVGLLISAFQSFLADLLIMFQASARNDMAALKSLSARIDADVKAPESLTPEMFVCLGHAAATQPRGMPSRGPVTWQSLTQWERFANTHG